MAVRLTVNADGNQCRVVNVAIGHVIAGETGKDGSHDVIVGKKQRFGSVAVDNSDHVKTICSDHSTRQAEIGRLWKFDQ